MRLFRKTLRRVRGFSLVELAAVSGMSVAVIGSSVLAYRAVAAQQTKSSNYGTVTIGTDNLRNFYGLQNRSKWDVWFAPNYGRAVRADEMRDLLYKDIEAASAVYALPRSGRSSVRPTAIALAGSTSGLEIDTPNAFRYYLNLTDGTASTTFDAYKGLPPDTAKNASLFVIQPSPNASANQLTVRCIWEVDLVPVGSTPAGTYATVRRYVGTTLTHYYDVFYKDDGTNFGPVFVHFERAARASTGPSATTTGEAFKKAGAHSFYLMWWPDPSVSKVRPNASLAPKDLTGTDIGSTDFRYAYAHHYGQTAYFFAIPMFPSVR